ncbi:MAG TPA: sodium:solute symporter family protein [Candidatus Baltobacteraceae bacterium]|nr:sodium:solute symporter family protein [Candidatus Baltobacteraceae bacterium]
MNATIALGIIAVIVIGTVIFALVSVRWISMSPQDYIVGGRGFGTVFLWVLLAGEIYTSFTFLGAAGWTYTFGAPAFYIMAYGTCGYIFYYFLFPWIWRLGKEHNLLTLPDLIQTRYNSRLLTTLVSIIAVVALIPYVTLQLSALQIFLTVAGHGAIDPVVGAVAAFVLIIAFVFVTGLRGTAWASILKDTLVIGALIFVGIAIPLQFFGSPAALFDQVLRAHPERLVLGALSAPKGSLWYVSTVLLTGLGFFSGPQSIAAIFSAKDENVLRRNAMFLPIYQLVMLLIFFAGFSALLIVPGLKGPAADQSFLAVITRYYPPWVLGFVAGAGALCALVPSTALLLSTASVVSKNIGSDLFGIGREDEGRLRLTRLMVVVMGLLALGLWLAYRTTLVDLLLLTYNGISQFMPAYAFGCYWKRTTTAGVTAGIVVGIVLACTLAAQGIAPFGINAGFVGLVANVIVLVGVSLLLPARTPAPEPAPL